MLELVLRVFELCFCYLAHHSQGELFMGRGMFQQCVSITRRGNADQEWRRITYVVFDAPTVRLTA